MAITPVKIFVKQLDCNYIFCFMVSTRLVPKTDVVVQCKNKFKSNHLFVDARHLVNSTTTMSLTPDPRTQKGSAITAKARLVTHESECRRQFGDTAWKTAVVTGTVIACETRVKNGKKMPLIHCVANTESRLLRMQNT